MRKRLIVIEICILAAITRCTADPIPYPSYPSYPSCPSYSYAPSESYDPSDLPDPSSLSETSIASEAETEKKGPEIVSGNMYEITANNFIEGLSHDFSPEEIEVWKEAIENDGFSKKYSHMGECRYMIHLYDTKGVEVEEYFLDDNGRLYDLEGMYVANNAVDEMLGEIVKTE